LKSRIRALARYWFIAPLLLAVVGLQTGLGFVTGYNYGTASRLLGSPTSDLPIASATRRPTFTSTPAPTVTSTFTPSPTRTPTPTETPTGTITPTETPLPSATPTGTDTPTPQPTPTATGLTLQVPILMYHYLSVPPAGADAIRRDLSVTPTQFEAHLAYLRQAGYETISLKQLSYALSGEAALPSKPIILTFDDGYRDNYENAFPLLRKYGYTATFFPITQPIDENNVSYLTWDMVKEMHQAGMEFGSHSYRHPDLSHRDVDFLVYEIVGSKEALEERIGEPIHFFSYPSGHYDELTIRVLESANFWGAVTTQWGIEQAFDYRFELKRLRMRGTDTAGNLAARLSAF
jgi:peptidoglycan/xylan/chitin deacetylase (PgdA/CDA1 family)